MPEAAAERGRPDGTGPVAAFLGGHPPFDTLDGAELAGLAAVAETEEHRSGSTILAEGIGPPAHVRVVQDGAVEIVHGGQVLDLLGPGELFGHAAMLAGLPLGFSAVARGVTTCLRLPADDVRTLLGRPAGLRYVARSLLAPTFWATRPGRIRRSGRWGSCCAPHSAPRRRRRRCGRRRGG